MWRIFILMLGGLFGPLSGAVGDASKKLEPPKADYIKKTVAVEIRGELEEEKSDILLPDGVKLKIRVEGKAYYLDFRGSKALWGKAANLMYQRVVVKGTLADRSVPTVVRVDTLDAAQPEIISCFVP